MSKNSKTSGGKYANGQINGFENANGEDENDEDEDDDDEEDYEEGESAADNVGLSYLEKEGKKYQFILLGKISYMLFL